jgi:hypothetical protein
MAVLCVTPLRWRRTIVLMLLAVLVLTGTTLASCQPDGPGPVVFSVGVALSVCLGWAGCKVSHRRPASEITAVPVPSLREIRPEDVLGSWQFYVDAASRTVTIDLRSDGRYAQVIVPNCGELVDCPGGTWSLEGPYLNLSSYRSALRDSVQSVRWIFGDWQNELVLLAKDDPLAETTLQARRCRTST